MIALSLSSAKPIPTQKPCNKTNKNGVAININHSSSVTWPLKPMISAVVTGALSFSIILSSPSISVALDSLKAPQPSKTPSSSIEFCQEEDGAEFGAQTAPNLGTNEGIVEEAWEIVNESFLDTGRHRWSPESWLSKKEDVLSSSIKTRSKAHIIVRRMLASLGDPYTRFLSPEELQIVQHFKSRVYGNSLSVHTGLCTTDPSNPAIEAGLHWVVVFSKMGRYDMTGIGINLREIPDSNGSFKLKVLGLILDGPAHTAGIRQGDEILSVDGDDVRGKTAFEVSSMLQGPNETFVTVEVKHGNCGPVESIKVQRQLVARTPVFYRLEQLDNSATSVGYVRLKEFNALARKDIVTAMKRLQDLGAACFVLDLRDNFGGLVQAGVEIAKLFLNKGDTVIYTAGRDQSPKAVVTETAPMVTAPVIVLVNHNTASASEIVASALHDNCKAVLVGEKTYGKGLIQSVFELHDGSGVVVTIGKYVTPGHLDINGNGIEPDFSVIPRWSEVTEHLSTCNRLRQG